MTGAADLVFGGDRDLAIGNQARLRRRPAHVEGDQVGKAELSADKCRGDDTGRRAGLDRHRRHAQPLGDVEDAAARTHHVELRQPERRNRTLQPVEVAREQRSDIGAYRGRAGALELADLGQHLRGEVDADPGKRAAQPLADEALMPVVEEREQKRYRHCFEPGVADRGDHTIDLGFVERDDDLPLRVDPLGDLKAPAARHQHSGRVLKQIIEVGARGPAELQHVAEAARRHKSGLRAFFLEQRVGHERRCMRQQRHRGRVHAIVREPLTDPVDHPQGDVARRGRDLGDADPARFLVDQRHVGKRPADIDTDPPRHREPLTLHAGSC